MLRITRYSPSPSFSHPFLPFPCLLASAFPSTPHHHAPISFRTTESFVQRHNLQSGPVPKFPRYNLNPFFVRETLCSCFCGNIFTVRSPLRQSCQPHRFVLRLDCADSELPLERVDRFKKCTLILDYIFLKCIIL